MSRLIIGQITIKKERTISSTEWYYLLQPANANPPDSSNYGNPPPIITDTGYSGWSTTEPTYTIGDERVLYQMVQTIFSDGSFSYTTPTISSSYEAAKAAYDEALQAESDIQDLQELGLHQGYIWYNSTEKAASGSIPVYPVGSYIASGINNTINQANSNTYGLNTWISTGGINLRYNAINLAKLTTSTLEFYYPSTSQQGSAAISLGTHSGVNSLIFYRFGSTNKQMELTGSSLSFYGSNQNKADTTLDSNGLKLVKGGIEAGEPNTNNFVYLSTDPYGTYTIHDSEQTDWKQIVGTNFGIRSDGSMYATSANISGTIHAIDGEFEGSLNAKLGFIGPWSISDKGLIYLPPNITNTSNLTQLTPFLFQLVNEEGITSTFFADDSFQINDVISWSSKNSNNLLISTDDIQVGGILIKDTLDTYNNTHIETENILKERIEAIEVENSIKNKFITIDETNNQLTLKRIAKTSASTIDITDTQIKILLNNNVITTYKDNLAHTTFGEFENLRMRVGNEGNLTWVTHSNGRLSLKIIV